MIYKEIDSKESEITTLKKLLLESKSEKQKELISKDLKAIENGYKAEKDNAYYLDFHFESRDKLILLHDIRIEYKGRTAQFDHLLIAPLGITILESKSFKGELTINDDNSLNVKYGKYTKTFPNPIEQNIRHEKVLDDFIHDTIELSGRFKMMGGIPINNMVLMHPNTTITNQKLPKGFERSDSFATRRNKDIDDLGVAKTLLAGVTYVTKEISRDIAKKLVTAHKPITFDYTKKYKISYSAPVKEQTNDEGKKCPRCKEGELVKRTRKSKKFGTQYKSNEFLGCDKFPKCRYTEEIS
jgi:ssDNA-binding Zn-finger/Zn-ribbon topoisomerase 1